MKHSRQTFFYLIFFIAACCSRVSAEEYTLINHSQLKQLIQQDLREFLLVDARNPEEYREAHIPGAINIPDKEFSRFTGILPVDKTSRLIFYCNGVKCGKSKKSAHRASELGYTNINVYAEGMPVWEEMGYSFYKGSEYEKRIETTKISPQELKDLMEKEKDNIQVVDVRDREEFAGGHIPGAVNLPLKEFAINSERLDKKKKVIVYCNSGGRSYGAYRKLMRLGYKDICQAIYADWQKMGFPVIN